MLCLFKQSDQLEKLAYQSGGMLESTPCSIAVSANQSANTGSQYRKAMLINRLLPRRSMFRNISSTHGGKSIANL